MALLSLVVALAEDRVIGRNNALPWHLPRDLKRFREITSGKPIIMGRKTFDSIGRPLPNRTNIVVTRDAKFQRSGVIVARHIDEAIEIARSNLGLADRGEIMVIGGEQIFDMALQSADRMYMTEVCTKIPDGDAHFPEFDVAEWEVSKEEYWAANEDNASFDCKFRILDRRL
jgi:dihydrofolate reductase